MRQPSEHGSHRLGHAVGEGVGLGIVRRDWGIIGRDWIAQRLRLQMRSWTNIELTGKQIEMNRILSIVRAEPFRVMDSSLLNP